MRYVGLVRSSEKNGNKQDPAALETHQYHGRNESNSRWLATRHVPRVSSRWPASADTGVVEIGKVQLSHSVMQKHDYYWRKLVK